MHFIHDVEGTFFLIFTIIVRSRDNVDGATIFFSFSLRAWMFEAFVADSAGRIFFPTQKNIVFASPNLFFVLHSLSAYVFLFLSFALLT